MQSGMQPGMQPGMPAGMQQGPVPGGSGQSVGQFEALTLMVDEGDVVEFRVARSEWTGELEAIDVRRVQSGSDNERRNGRRDERREQGAAPAARVPSEDTNE